MRDAVTIRLSGSKLRSKVLAYLAANHGVYVSCDLIAGHLLPGCSQDEALEFVPLLEQMAREGAIRMHDSQPNYTLAVKP